MPSLPAHARAAIFDVYGTLLHGPRHPDTLRRMNAVVARFDLPALPDIDLVFTTAIAAAHRRSPAPWPEVDVRELWSEIFPNLADPDAFSLGIEEAIHPVRPHPIGAALMDEAASRGLRLGIVSNAQAYTPTLLARHFPTLWPLIDPALTAFSFHHRIAKPDPRLFRIPLDALTADGIAPQEIVMIGDSPENDLTPARALGMHTIAIPPA